MGLELCARGMISVVAMPCGRATVLEALGRAAPGISAIFDRSFASLVGSGIPSPRPDVALHLSTPHGGHVNRMVNTSESIVELDYVLHKYRKVLRPANIGAATMKLEYLRNYEQSNPHAHKVLRVAAELHKYVDTFSDRLSLTQVANVVRGMSSVQYRLPQELLLRLAGGVVASDCAALRFAADSDIRDVFYGFSGQGFTNPLFWSRVCAAVLPRLESLEPNTLPALVKSLELAQQLPTQRAAVPAGSARRGEPTSAVAPVVGELTPQVAVARTALRRLLACMDRLQPARLADAAGQLVTVAPALGAVEVDEQLVDKVQAAALRSLPSLNPAHLTSLLLALQRLRQAATAVTAPTAAAAAAAAPFPPDFLAAAVPHLQVAAPNMQLLHVKRAVQALAPSATAATTAEAASGGDSAAGSTTRAPPRGATLDHLLNVLARRASLLLPSAAQLAAGAPRLLTRGTLSKLPVGGKGAGAVLRAVSPAGDPRVGLDTPLLGMLEGLVWAYSCAMAPTAAAALAGGGGGVDRGGAIAAAAAAAAAGDVRQVLRTRLPDVATLFEKVAVVAAAGRARGLLSEEQRTSLEVRMTRLLSQEAVALLLPPAQGPAQLQALPTAETTATRGAGGQPEL